MGKGAGCIAFRTGLAAALGGVVLGSGAQAEPPGVCQTYAEAAVSAHQQALGLRCPVPIQGPRWQASYDNHYNWCLGAPAGAVRAEHLHRENLLRVCRGELRARQCHEYASNAKDYALINLNNHCGFTGPRWTTSYEDHLGWCLASPDPVVNWEFGVRFNLISLCVAPTPELRRCDAYARRAVAQVAESVSRRCRPEGPRWIAEYDPHFMWCHTVVQTGEANPDAETGAREGWLSQCRTFNPPQ